MGTPLVGLDAALQQTGRGHSLALAEQLWLAQQAQRLHATLCTALVALTDCQKLLHELDAEPEILAEVQLVLDTVHPVLLQAEGKPCP
jgi:hypothetical protein